MADVFLMHVCVVHCLLLLHLKHKWASVQRGLKQLQNEPSAQTLTFLVTKRTKIAQLRTKS